MITTGKNLLGEKITFRGEIYVSLLLRRTS